MKPLVIYHANCADGFGAAFAAWLKLGDEAEYVPMQYGKIDFDFEGGFFNLGKHEADNPCTFVAGRDVYILDFSFPREVMDHFFANAKRVVWLDHHKTAFEMWEVQPGQRVWAETEGRHVKLHMDKSGAMLAWEYFHPDTEVPMFIKHIDDYDRWQFKIEGTKAFNKALWSKPFDFRAWEIIFLTPGYEDAAYRLCYTDGYAILRAHDQNVQAVLKGAKRPCTIIGTFDAKIVGLACNCPSHLTSDVGHQLANESGSYGLCWYVNKDNLVICSLRSNGDYDVSAIAKEFGGGGHRNAAGFTTTIQTIMEWTK